MIKKIGVLCVAALVMLTALGSANANAQANKTMTGAKETLLFERAAVAKSLAEDGIMGATQEAMIAALSHFSYKLQPVLDAYIADRTISDAFNVEGLTTKMCMKEYDTTFWTALGLMNLSIHNPERAMCMAENIRTGRNMPCNKTSSANEETAGKIKKRAEGAKKRDEQEKTVKFDRIIVEKIMQEEGIIGFDQDLAINGVSKISYKLQPVLDAYIADRTISDSFKIEGLTTKMCMRWYRTDFWTALIFMDVYSNEKSNNATFIVDNVRMDNESDQARRRNE